MAVCKITLDQDTYEKLVAIAFRELRPPHWQAEVLLRKAIRQESSAAAPVLQASTTDNVEHQAHK